MSQQQQRNAEIERRITYSIVEFLELFWYPLSGGAPAPLELQKAMEAALRAVHHARFDQLIAEDFMDAEEAEDDDEDYSQDEEEEDDEDEYDSEEEEEEDDEEEEKEEDDEQDEKKQKRSRTIK